MKILILGSKGFIGRSLIENFVTSKLLKNVNIIGIDYDRVSCISSYEKDNVLYYNMDCSVQTDELQSILYKELPDVIINSAAMNLGCISF